MDILSGIVILLMGWLTVDAKMELNDLKNQPPKIVEVIKIVEVDIPVATQCPIPKDIKKPVLEITKLTPTDRGNFDKIANSYVVSLNQCMSFAEQQENVLNSYREEVIKE